MSERRYTTRACARWWAWLSADAAVRVHRDPHRGGDAGARPQQEAVDGADAVEADVRRVQSAPSGGRHRWDSASNAL